VWDTQQNTHTPTSRTLEIEFHNSNPGIMMKMKKMKVREEHHDQNIQKKPRAIHESGNEKEMMNHQSIENMSHENDVHDDKKNDSQKNLREHIYQNYHGDRELFPGSDHTVDDFFSEFLAIKQKYPEMDNGMSRALLSITANIFPNTHDTIRDLSHVTSPQESDQLFADLLQKKKETKAAGKVERDGV
jgi:hypothetical protein